MSSCQYCKGYHSDGEICPLDPIDYEEPTTLMTRNRIEELEKEVNDLQADKIFTNGKIKALVD